MDGGRERRTGEARIPEGLRTHLGPKAVQPTVDQDHGSEECSPFPGKQHCSEVLSTWKEPVTRRGQVNTGFPNTVPKFLGIKATALKACQCHDWQAGREGGRQDTLYTVSH